MLLTQQFCKNVSSDYDKLINEEGYFDSDSRTERKVNRITPVASVKKYIYHNMPRTAEELVSTLIADKARVEKMNDLIGKEIVTEGIVELEIFLNANNIAF